MVAALPEEVAPLIRRLAGRRPGGRRFDGGSSGSRRPVSRAQGELGGWELTVAVSGVGRRAAERAAAELLDRPSVGELGDHETELGKRSGVEVPNGRQPDVDTLALLLVVGVAGGLTPGLAAGSLVVAREVVDEKGMAPPPDPGWLDKALARPGVLAGRVVTAARVAATPVEKAEIRRHLGGAEVEVVDLESAVWARAAGRRAVPYLIVRAVSDAAEESLPLDFEALRGPGGELSRLGVAVQALRRPRSLAALWQLRGRVRCCAEELARFVTGVLA